jgi:serine/threonine protein kinase
MRYPPDRRRTYVRQVCGANDLLLTEVESLLDSYEQTHSFLETPAVVQVVENASESENLLSSGEILGHYEIGDLIGAGGMGEVYLARDIVLNRKVAIKLLRQRFLPDAQAKQRLLREARTAALLEHPNICQIYEIAETSDHCFIVMQYVVGTTLADILAKRPLGAAASLDLAIQIADGLAEAHSHGIIHRDIKPANIIVNGKGQVKILDFGLAKFLETETSVETSARLTTSGAVMGTVPFMSPEQLRGELADERTDIFSFGVLLYEMLGGKPAFTRNSNAETISAILNDEPDWSLVPATLKPTLEKCLTKDKSSRYNSVRALAADLTEARKDITDDALTPPATQRGRQNAETNPTTPKKRQFYFWQTGDDVPTAHPEEVASGKVALTPSRWFGSVGLAAMIVILLLFGSAAAVLLWKLNRTDDSPNLDALKMVQLTSWKAGTSSNSTEFHVSHNGKFVAYSSSRQGGEDAIYIKQTSGGEEFQVTKNTAENVSPLWAPDDQSIAFVTIRKDQPGGGIYKSQTLGGAVTLLKTFDKVNSSISLRHWALDDSAIFYEQLGNLFRLDLAKNEVKKITELPDRYDPRDFSFSPDEKQIVFCDTRDGQTDIWTMPIEGGEMTQITNDKDEESRPLWCPDGQIIYNILRDDLYQIDRIRVGGAPVRVTLGNGDYVPIDISPDGRQLYYVSTDQRSDIRSVDVVSLRESEVATQPAGELWADPSPDGRSIVYQYNSGPHLARNIFESTIMIKSFDGQATPLTGKGFDARWLPDSRHISVFRMTDETKGEFGIWLIDTVTEEAKPITSENVATRPYSLMPTTRGEVSVLDFSPDSKRIVYLDWQKPQNVRLGSLEGDFTSLTKNENPNVQYFSPLFSRDGSRIATVSVEHFQDEARKPMRRVLVSGLGGMKDIFSTTESLRLIGWSSADTVALATTKRPMVDTPIYVNIVAATVNGASSKLFTLEGVYPRTLTISPDGRTLAFTARRDDRDNIWILALSPTAEQMKVTSNADSALFLSNLAFSANGKVIYFDEQGETNTISMIENFK